MDPKAGFLYLGDYIDGEGTRKEPLAYEAADLTTHGVIVGMTGSGKTGLAIDLLEEALLNGIPALIIDPKGDMTNLLLNFPELTAEKFRPWIDESIARREGIGPDELAARTAKEWSEGLASWDIGQDRMSELKSEARFTIYTPGSTAGVPVNVLGSLAAPDTDDIEAVRDEIEGFVSSLLVLAGIDSDPISGPDHILLSNIVEYAWNQKQDLDLASLIGQIQQPPFRKLGVFELDAFIPPRDRTALAMKLNGLVASPSFAAWRDGPPLDIKEILLSPPEGKISGAIFYLAHLSDSERQFFVTLLLSKLVTFMRSWYGSSDLRAIVYMDEIAGFCPPSAEPPAKKPIMTLAKQARAFGYGMVLTTQNPMDFDYKVMSNAGTWAIGRLQTERDKARILEAMQSASGGVDTDLLDRQISGLGKRQFVLHTTRGTPPQLFTSRWAMSYLAGPLSKVQIRKLMGDRPVVAEVAPGVIPAVPPATPPAASASAPPAAPGVVVNYLDPAASWAGQVNAVPGSQTLRPAIAAVVNLLYDDAPSGTEHREAFETIITDLEQPLTAKTVIAVDHDARDFLPYGPADATFASTTAALDKPSFWKGMSSALLDYLVASRRVRIWKNPGLKLYSRVGELESDFRARCIAAADEECDKAIAALRDKYRTRIDRVRDELAVAQRRVSDLEADLSARKQEEVVSGAGDLLGAILGGRRRNAISRAATRRSQTKRTGARRDTAAEAVSEKQTALNELEADLADDVNAITAEFDDKSARIEEIQIPLEKIDVKVVEMKLVWVPTANPKPNA